MRVGVVASDAFCCEHYRAAGPAEVLAAAGEIEYVRLDEELRLRYAMRRSGDTELVGFVEKPDVDVVVLVRGVFASRIHDVVRLLQREGVAVVVDYDDAYDRIPLSMRARVDPSRSHLYNWRLAREAAKIADVVTVSTPALLRYRSDAVLLRNCIAKHYIESGRRAVRHGDRVGWGGSVPGGHPDDLRVCGAGVAQAVRETGAQFWAVGDGHSVQGDLNLDQPPVVTGLLPFYQYAEQLARLDVAIAPLRPTLYADAKSGLKILESLACGSQVVASDSLEYVRLYDELETWSDGPNPVAIVRPRARAWRRAVLNALLRDEDQRKVLADTGRRFIAENYSMEDRAYEWAEAWELAVKRRREAKCRGPARSVAS